MSCAELSLAHGHKIAPFFCSNCFCNVPTVVEVFYYPHAARVFMRNERSSIDIYRYYP